MRWPFRRSRSAPGTRGTAVPASPPATPPWQALAPLRSTVRKLELTAPTEPFEAGLHTRRPPWMALETLGHAAGLGGPAGVASGLTEIVARPNREGPELALPERTATPEDRGVPWTGSGGRGPAGQPPRPQPTDVASGAHRVVEREPVAGAGAVGSAAITPPIRVVPVVEDITPTARSLVNASLEHLDAYSAYEGPSPSAAARPPTSPASGVPARVPPVPPPPNPGRRAAGPDIEQVAGDPQTDRSRAGRPGADRPLGLGRPFPSGRGGHADDGELQPHSGPAPAAPPTSIRPLLRRRLGEVPRDGGSPAADGDEQGPAGRQGAGAEPTSPHPLAGDQVERRPPASGPLLVVPEPAGAATDPAKAAVKVMRAPPGATGDPPRERVPSDELAGCSGGVTAWTAPGTSVPTHVIRQGTAGLLSGAVPTRLEDVLAARTPSAPSALGPWRGLASSSPPVQRQVVDDPREPSLAAAQRPAHRHAFDRPAPPDSSGGDTLPSEPVPPSLRSAVEATLGADLFRVEVKRGNGATSEARRLGARGFTAGSAVHVPAAQGPLVREPARSLVVHELVHVAQQQRLGPNIPSEGSTAGGELEGEARMLERTWRVPIGSVPPAAPDLSVPTPHVGSAEPRSLPSPAPKTVPCNDPGHHVQRAEGEAEPVAELRGPPPTVPSATGGDLEQLADQLFPRIRGHFLAELRDYRERSGTLVDL